MSKYWTLALFVIAVLLLTAGCPKPKAGGENAATANRPNTPAAGSPNAAAPEGTPAPDATTPEGTPAADGTTPPATDATAPGTEGTPPATEPGTPGGTDLNDPNVVQVVFETTAGNFTIAVHKDWAPIGAQHFLDLIGVGYYDGAPFFRVVRGFMAQTGFSGKYELTQKYLNQSIQDEPVKHGNLRGTLSFGNTGQPNSRGTHIFINFGDNSRLDTAAAPFPAFAEVVEGMDVVDKLYVTGENPGTVQSILSQPGGIEQFKQMYPEASFITKAYVKK